MHWGLCKYLGYLISAADREMYNLKYILFPLFVMILIIFWSKCFNNNLYLNDVWNIFLNYSRFVAYPYVLFYILIIINGFRVIIQSGTRFPALEESLIFRKTQADGRSWSSGCVFGLWHKLLKIPRQPIHNK